MATGKQLPRDSKNAQPDIKKNRITMEGKNHTARQKSYPQKAFTGAIVIP